MMILDRFAPISIFRVKDNECLLFRYTYVLLNDFFTAGNGVLMKKKLESKDLGAMDRNMANNNLEMR